MSDEWLAVGNYCRIRAHSLIWQASFPTTVGVGCPPRKHCALRALLPHPLTRGWGSSGSAAWGPRAVAGLALIKPTRLKQHWSLVTNH